MTFMYIGTGALDAQTRDAIRGAMNDYPFMCEVVKRMGSGTGERLTWATFHPWIEANIKEWPGWDEDHPKPYRPVGTIHKNGFDGDTWFVCFKRERDRAAFMDRFRAFVVHSEPLKVFV